MLTEFIKPLPVVHGKNLLHSFESHNYWIDRNKVCPYCMSGSKPVQKVLVDEVKDGTY